MTPTHKYKFASVILAAGKGSRMRSQLPKVMHKLAHRPLISHVLDTQALLSPEKTVVVLAKGMDSVATICTPAAIAIQEQQRGTGDALKSALPQLGNYQHTVLVLYGDTPLVTAATLARVLEAAESAQIVAVGMRVADPTGYGRLMVDASGQLEEIVEERDATPEQKKNTLCNSGIMAISGKHLATLLNTLEPHNTAGEYYLTDIVGLAGNHKLHCHVVEADVSELAGINTREQLAQAEHDLQTRLRKQAMENGATLVDPQTIYLASDTKLGQDVVVHPHVVFGPQALVEDGVEIRSFSHIEGATVKKNAIIGPFARLRPGSVIGVEAHVGNFVELKNTTLGDGAKANHLSYVGDSMVGSNANIGAGTITCNYDGVNKHKTIIGEGAFIGSNSSLVAPVTIGAGAVIGAGSVITQDVEADALALERSSQIVKPGRGAKKKTT
ncbi:MAG: bifunctional UDP-N-acetylglucosamine diphosphorylase/glucosamine-1-phosphate N-acetyltransferase GlmU [Rickettsiales bacterium]|nr:bifunctional UDP-N-acetylglucosamine diphosphorylase/glucosamine-1-phosphate N-acetyltransferase GlmU [Rickettsiales bacterium]